MVVVARGQSAAPQQLPHYSFVTVTKQAASETRRCQWCGRPFAFDAGSRSATAVLPALVSPAGDYEARRRGHELGLAESDVVIARS